MREGHVPVRWLVDRRDGVLRGGRAARTQDHLAAGCPSCVERAHWIGRAMAALEGGPLEAPPPAAVRSVLAAFRRDGPVPRTAPPDDVLVGFLLVDRPLAFAAATRAGVAGARRLLWSVGGYEIDAALTECPGGTKVSGQVLPPGDDPSRAVTGRVAARRRRIVARGSIAADGRFTLRGLRRGVYVIEGEIDGRRFVTPTFAVR